MSGNPNPQRRKTAPAASAMAKINAFMQRMNIECTPANFELLFAVVSGQNDELREEFGKLDRNIRQTDLDVLIKKHIPHHVEDDIASESLDTIGDEIHKFIDLVKSESSSLESFDKVLKEETQSLADPSKVCPEQLRSSISTISAATEKKIEDGKKVTAAVNAQVERLNNVATDLDTFKKQKFLDPLTELPNRRAFNKETLTIYQGERPRECVMVLFEIDSYAAVKTSLGPLISDKYVVHVGQIVKEFCSTNDYIARANENQFACIFDKVADTSVKSIAEKILKKTASSPLINATNGQPIGNVTISAGICASPNASSTGDIMAKTENALSQSLGGNGNKATLFQARRASDGNDLERNNWSLYNEAS